MIFSYGGDKFFQKFKTGFYGRGIPEGDNWFGWLVGMPRSSHPVEAAKCENKGEFR